MEGFARILVVGGLGIAAVGGLLLLLERTGVRVGRLPGDVVVQREGFTLFAPLTTMLLLSGVATLVLWLISSFRR